MDRRGLAATIRRPEVIAVLGACTVAFSGALVKLADVSPATAATFRCAYALPVLAVLALRERRRLGPRRASDRALALAAGMVFAADLLVWHRAIGDIGAGLATVLGNLQVAVVPLVAWAVFGHRPTRRVAVAIALASVGVVLLAGVLEQGAYGQDPRRGVILGIVSGVAYSAFLMLFRAGSRDTRRGGGQLFDVTVAAMAVSLVAGAGLGDLDLRPSWPAHGWLVALALSAQVIGWLLIAASIARLSPAVSSVLLTVQPVAAVGLGNLIFGEAPSVLQLLGVVAIVATLAIAMRDGGAVPAARTAPRFIRSPRGRRSGRRPRGE